MGRHRFQKGLRLPTTELRVVIDPNDKVVASVPGDDIGLIGVTANRAGKHQPEGTDDADDLAVIKKKASLYQAHEVEITDDVETDFSGVLDLFLFPEAKSVAAAKGIVFQGV